MSLGRFSHWEKPLQKEATKIVKRAIQADSGKAGQGKGKDQAEKN
jgi:hypothetical protein